MKIQKDNMKIVYLGRYNKSELLSGPEKVAKRIFSEHARNNITYFIQYFFDGKTHGLRQKLFGIDSETIDGGSKIYTAGIFQVYKLLKKIQPDIIHIINYERFTLAAIIYKFFNKVKIIYNEHGVIAYENEIKNNSYIYRLKDKFCEKRLLNNSDKIVFVSEQALDIAEKYYSFNENKCVILANGVDKIFNSMPEKDFSLRLKAVINYPNKLYAGGFNFLNNCITKHNPEIELFVICGDELIIPGAFKKAIPMLPEQLHDFYSDKHIFFSLNSYDTFSISTAEAMSCGLIPVVTKQTGISRFIEHGINGYLVDYGNTEQLNEIIINLYKMLPAKKESISIESSAIYNELNWGNIYASYRNLYQMI